VEAFTIVGFALVCVVLLALVRQAKPEMAIPLTLGAVMAVFLMVADKLAAVFMLVEDLSHVARLNAAYLNVILKVIGVAYITEFGVQICRDAGESALSAKVEFAGKVLVLLLAVPVVRAVMHAVLSIMA
jgi:stage III sporulation protein AD